MTRRFLRFGDYFCCDPGAGERAVLPPARGDRVALRDGLGAVVGEPFHALSRRRSRSRSSSKTGRALTPTPPDELTCRGRRCSRRWAWRSRAAISTRGTVAAFKCTPLYLHNHGHRDANSFTIYHKGDLAIDSGGVRRLRDAALVQLLHPHDRAQHDRGARPARKVRQPRQGRTPTTAGSGSSTSRTSSRSSSRTSASDAYRDGRSSRTAKATASATSAATRRTATRKEKLTQLPAPRDVRPRLADSGVRVAGRAR